MPERSTIEQLLSQHSLVSDQVDTRELSIILAELQSVATQPQTLGAVVEFGCYIGTTSLFIRRLLNTIGSTAVFHVYDSFVGLPEKSVKDQSPAGEQFKAGELSVSRKQFVMQFKKAGLQVPVVHKDWFSNLRHESVPDKIAFAYLDGDYYDSITDSLRLIWPKLAPGARIVIDDYVNEALPGARRAVDDWLVTHSGRLRVEASLAILTDISS